MQRDGRRPRRSAPQQFERDAVRLDHVHTDRPLQSAGQLQLCVAHGPLPVALDAAGRAKACEVVEPALADHSAAIGAQLRFQRTHDCVQRSRTVDFACKPRMHALPRGR